MFEIVTNSLLYLTLSVIIGLGLVVTLFVLVRDVLLRMSGSGLILLLGLAALFVGERWMGEGTARMAFSGLGVLVLLGSIGLRGFAMGRSEGERRTAHQRGLVFSGLVVVGLALYGITLESVTGALGFGEEALSRWTVTWQCLSPIVVLLGVLPVLGVDRVLAAHPRAIPRGALRRAVENGLGSALAISLLFPVNYLANTHDKTWDLAYFRTTAVGESTKSIVGSLAEPVTVTLFYPAGNDTRKELEPYFTDLQNASGGQIDVRVVDQALEPALAEELGVRDNGTIAFTQGEIHEKFKLDTDIERAKRDLKTLDEEVRKTLIKLTRGQRTIYWMVGHGEASTKEKEDQLRKLSVFKRGILDPENLKLVEFGITNGSADKVPDDASVVVLAAPEKELLPEEIDVLKAWLDGGGKLLLLSDPGSDKLTALTDHIGVEVGDGPLAHMQAFVPIVGGKADRVNLASNKFGSHESVKLLSRNSSQMGVVMPTVRWVRKKADTKNRVSTLMRSFPDTWSDDDGDFEAGEGEEKKVFEVAVAVSGEGEDGFKAIVVGDVNLYSDVLLQRSQGNALFARDTLLWLLDDPDAAGDIESEEDVKVVHTREEDLAWFAMTVLGMPLLILGFGIILVRVRGRNR